jgi:glyceraldehyde 3-phosphate dehydrogenase
MSDNNLFLGEINIQNRQNRATVEFIKTISDLWYENSIELLLFRNQLIDKNVSEILNLVDYARKFVEKPITIYDVLEMAQTIQTLDLPTARLDVGKLAYEYMLNKGKYEDKSSFLLHELSHIYDKGEIDSKDVILYGFGRIGRLVARELVSKVGNGNQLRLRAIVVRGEITLENLEKRAALLRSDSVHGHFPGTVSVDFENSALNINGMTVHIINASSPDSIDYTKYGINEAVVIDNTGVWRDREGLGKHLKSKGVTKVLLTAPGKEDIPNIVFGVNHNDFDPESQDIFSAASCTTNAITPILKVIEDQYGIVNGHIETIHAYTNDQNLVDNYHKKYRRGRAAGLNMVITETGAGNAVAKALPQLKGKLTSNAIRVPVPNGSLAILNLTLANDTDLPHLNLTMKKAALDGDLVEQIKYAVSNELVSSDIIGTSAPAIYDSHATVVHKNGNNVVLYIWYDNEYGYVHQVIRLAKHLAAVRRFHHY